MGKQAHYFETYLADLRSFAAAIKSHPRGRITQFDIGEPATEDTISAVQPTFSEDGEMTQHGEAEDPGTLPDELLEIARIADGAQLKWSVEVAGKKRVSGDIHVPSLQWLQENTTRAFEEGELGFSLAPSARDTVLVLPCDSDGIVYALDDNDQIRAEDLTVDEVRSAELMRLGIPGWDSAFKQHAAGGGEDDEGGGEDDDGDGDRGDDDEGDGDGDGGGGGGAASKALAKCEQQAMLVYQALGLPIPRGVERGSRGYIGAAVSRANAGGVR